MYVRDLAQPAPVELGGAGRLSDRVGDFAWSPDSSRFAFSAWDGPREGLYSARADGSELRQLAAGHTVMAAWSLDGRRIAFADRECLRVVDAAGGAPPDCVATMPASATLHGLAWSPDGRTLAASGRVRCAALLGCVETVLVDVDRRQARPLLAGTWRVLAPETWGAHARSGFAAWSPDGRWLAFASGAVVIVDIATGQRRTLVGESASANEVAWSPDGAMLAYASAGTGLGVVRLDGGGKKLLYVHDYFSGIHWSPQGILASAFTARATTRSSSAARKGR